MAKQEGTLTKYTTYTLGLIYESTLSLKRIVNDWNILPGSAVMSASVNQFKGHIDKYLRNRAEDYMSQRLTPFLVNSSTT